MTRFFLALLLGTVMTCANAQTQLTLHISGKYQPTDWWCISGPWAEVLTRDSYEFWPVLQAEAGILKRIGTSQWHWEAQLSFRHTRQVLDPEAFNFSGQVDPYYGFVSQTRESADFSRSEHFNYAGVKLGAAYELELPRNNQAILFPLGLQMHVPAFSRVVSKYSGEKKVGKTYRDEEFKYGIYYGLYLRPTYQFSFAQKRSNPWRFNVYAEADALIHHKSEVNPKFLWGGGLGVSYRLGKAF